MNKLLFAIILSSTIFASNSSDSLDTDSTGSGKASLTIKLKRSNNPTIPADLPVIKKQKTKNLSESRNQKSINYPEGFTPITIGTRKNLKIFEITEINLFEKFDQVNNPILNSDANNLSLLFDENLNPNSSFSSDEFLKVKDRF